MKLLQKLKKFVADFLLNLFPDKPSKPGTPEILDYDVDSADIRWSSPKTDGGSPITHYIIQQKVNGGDWQKVDVFNTPTGNEVLEYRVNGLVESSKVQFRVIAVNKAGESEPSDPSPTHTVKHRKCKTLSETRTKILRKVYFT